MKNKFRLLLIICIVSLLSIKSFAQVGIGVTTVIPDNSAILDLQAVDKGFLLPRTSQTLIVNPAKGLLIYDTNQAAEGFFYYNGTQWIAIKGGASGYNSGIGINILGDTINANTDSLLWNALKLYNIEIDSSSPSANQLLTYDGTKWTAIDADTAYPVQVSALIAGTGLTIDSLGQNKYLLNALPNSAIWNANKLLGNEISGLLPLNNQVLAWNNITLKWEPTGLAAAMIPGNGIEINYNTINALNTTNLWNANRLQHTPVSMTSPDTNYILGYDGVNWIPIPPKNAAIVFTDSAYFAGIGIVIDTATMTLSGDISSPLWNANKIQGHAVDTTTPQDGQILAWSDTSGWYVTDLTNTIWIHDNSNVYRSKGNVGIGTSSPDGLLHVESSGLINGATFSDAGSGQDDLTVDPSSPYSGGIVKTYKVEVSASSTNPDSFTWSDDNGVTWSNNQIMDINWITLNNGIRIRWTTPDGHSDGGASNGDTWQWTASPGHANTFVVKEDNVGLSTSSPHSSAILDLTSSDKGFLMTRTITSAIIGPAEGLLIYDTSQANKGFHYWDGTQWGLIGSGNGSNDSIDGSKAIKRTGWSGVSGTVVGNNGTVVEFLNDVFFPFVPATISINSSAILREIGTSTTVNLTGVTTANDETIFSNGQVNQTYPSGSNVLNFGAATTYTTSITFAPTKADPNTQELRFKASQTVSNNGTPITINSGTKTCRSVYPFLHGVNASSSLTSGGTGIYTALTKLIQTKSNKTVTLNGTGYIYFAYPASYGDLQSIKDQNQFEFIFSFTKYTANVSSSGLVNNWVNEPYNIYISNLSTTPSNWDYQFKF